MNELKHILSEDLRKWFGKGKQGGVGGGGWDRYDTSGNRVGKCGDAKAGDPYSACLSREKAEKLGKEGRAAFVKRKRAAQSKGGDSKKGGEHIKGQKPIKVKTGINEIGDSGATTYPFTNPSKGIYRFKSDSGLEYRIELEEHSHPSLGQGSILEISYRLLGDMYNMVTNKGEQFRVMATLIETVKDYLKDNPQVNRISFVPVKSFDRENDNRRANLYMAYVKKQLPGATVKIDGNRFTIDLPEKLPEGKVNEIGDASGKTYNLKLYRSYAPDNTIAPEVIYNFTTDSGLEYELALSGYEMQTADELTGAVDVSFKMAGGTYTAQTNAGEQFKIMATVVDATKKYLKDNPKVNTITFVPVKSRSESDKDSRRERMYLAYVKSQFPNAKIDIKPYMYGTNKVIVKLPKRRVAEQKNLIERLNLFLEKNIPTDPAKWSYYKAQAKKKFDVYPSAYANGWAAKKYKEAGGGWRKSK